MLSAKSKRIIEKRNFRISQSEYGKGFLVRVPSQGFEYDHDAVVDANKQRLKTGSAKKSWNEYGYYSKTSGYPNWAAEFVREY
jgi:hypothetical protein